MKDNKGITLVALVITIIVLLILAGVTIASLSGDNGILTRGKEAKQMNEIGEVKDQINMLATEAITDYYQVKYVDAGATTKLDEPGKASEKAAVEKYINDAKASFKNVSVTYSASTITIKSSDGGKQVTGTVGTNGKITWN